MSDFWIQTRSGKAFDLLDPRPEQICIADIAWALGRLSRYTGHGLRHCSVAEHSIRCADIALRKYGRAVAWDCLMHDAGEAYTGDISRPLKKAMSELYETYVKSITSFFLPQFDPFSVIEAKVSACVENKYDVLHCERVKKVDTADLAVEMKLNLSLPPPRAWAFNVEAMAHQNALEDPGLWEDLAGDMTPIEAAECFLVKVAELAPSDAIQEEALEAMETIYEWQAEAMEVPRLGGGGVV